MRSRKRANNNREVSTMKRTDKLRVTININVFSGNKLVCDTKTMMILIVLMVSIPTTLTISSGNFDMLADFFRSLISIAFGS